MPIRHPVTVCLCTLVATGLGSGCGTPDPAPQRPLRIVVSGDTGGWIIPCGCASNQAGGLLRRGTYLARLRQVAEVMYLDAGGAAAGTSEYDRLKMEAIAAGELVMQVAAHNIGASEAALGVDYLHRLRSELQLPLVSCNVRSGDGRLVGEALRRVTFGGRRVAVVGVLADSDPPAGVRIDPPREAILATLRDFAGQYDSLIVLAYLAEKELSELAANLPEADLVVGGPTGQSLVPQRFGPTWVAAATNKGKFLVQFDASPSRTSGWSGTVLEMDASFADDRHQQRNVEQFYAVLTARDLEPAQTSFTDVRLSNPPPDYQVAGSAICRDCHEDESRAWLESRHARAWHSLERRGAHVDPFCQQCHTTGFGLPGGFISAGRSPARTGVGCESCHGPSQGHVLDHRVRTTLAAQAGRHCTRCHDRENSPHFGYDAAWTKIRHGGVGSDQHSDSEDGK